MKRRIKNKAKKVWVIIFLGAVILFIVIGKLIKKNKNKPTDVGEQATNIMSQMGVSSSDMAVLNNKTLQIAEKLGVSYSWYNPMGWSEDDEGVYNLLKNITQTEFDILSKLYFEVYAKGRNLSQDLASYLDSSYYELLIIK